VFEVDVTQVWQARGVLRELGGAVVPDLRRLKV
jgi:hypothetical protein